jgi:hypothetical protein
MANDNFYNDGNIVPMAPFYVDGGLAPRPDEPNTGFAGLFSAIGGLISNVATGVGQGIATKVQNKIAGVTSPVNGGSAPAPEQFNNPTAGSNPVATSAGGSTGGIDNKTLAIMGGLAVAAIVGIAFAVSKK